MLAYKWRLRNADAACGIAPNTNAMPDQTCEAYNVVELFNYRLGSSLLRSLYFRLSHFKFLLNYFDLLLASIDVLLVLQLYCSYCLILMASDCLYISICFFLTSYNFQTVCYNVLWIAYCNCVNFILIYVGALLIFIYSALSAK